MTYAQKSELFSLHDTFLNESLQRQHKHDTTIKWGPSMSEHAVGSIQRVHLRNVWDRELNFSAWLQENIESVNEVTDLSLASAEREQSAGAFSVDLVAEDDSGNTVIIENQLGKSDHDHLGKLITYLTAIRAQCAVWIVSDPRPEHVAAVSWLNESSNADFYLLKVEAIKIEESPPAPLLTLIVGPSEETREVSVTKKEMAERYELRRRFWSALLPMAKEKTRLHANVSPGRKGWIGASAGKRGLSYNYVIKKDQANVELYIDRGKDADDENLAIFDTLSASKANIEAAFGGQLEWERLDSRRACRIKAMVSASGYREQSAWTAIQTDMIDAMVRLEQALRAHIGNLDM